jgi:hypothetical protein
MTRAILGVAVVLVFTGPSFAQPSDLKAAMDARNAALAAGDEQTWARYTTDDFINTNADGVVVTKTQRMAAIKGTKSTAPSAKVTEERFRTYGDTVIQTWRAEQQPPVRYTQVWVRQAGVWKVATVHLARITKP